MLRVQMNEDYMKQALSYAKTYYNVARSNLCYRSPCWVANLTQKLFNLDEYERYDVVCHLENRAY